MYDLGNAADGTDEFRRATTLHCCPLTHYCFIKIMHQFRSPHNNLALRTASVEPPAMLAHGSCSHSWGEEHVNRWKNLSFPLKADTGQLHPWFTCKGKWYENQPVSSRPLWEKLT